jgi:hypothetical protein
MNGTRMNTDSLNDRGSESDAMTFRSPTRSRLPILFAVLALVAAATIATTKLTPHVHAIGATAEVTELSTGAVLDARVDTGAILCSIHCDEIEAPQDDAAAKSKLGRTIRFRIHDKAGQPHWIETKLEDLSSIRTTAATRNRYCVYLPLRVAGVEAEVLVTLNDRSTMRFPFLIGRNLLRDRFVVDVRVGNDDPP